SRSAALCFERREEHRRLAGFVDASADRRVVEDLTVLDVLDDAVGIDEERLRQCDHTVAARDGAVCVEERLQVVERQRVDERADLRAILLKIYREEDRI